MKKTILTLLSVLFCAITFAQNVPQGINYQALARDATGDVLINHALTVRFSILEGTAISWEETHQDTTNAYGLFTAIIGDGTTTNGGSSSTFDLIDWGAAAHSLKVEIDYGNEYLDMGTTDFMSVPYSLHAKTAANVSTTDELQSLLIFEDTLFISGGNYIILPSSVPTLLGCTDTLATNYNSLANTDDGTCIPFIYGCMDPLYIEYDASANTADGSCTSFVVNGCTDTSATNYNTLANTDDGSCIAVVNGCIDPLYIEYDNSANTDDGSCTLLVVNGCIDSTSINYNYLANTDDSSCIAIVNGCIDPLYIEYDTSANTDDGSCTSLVVNGCIDSTSINYNYLANTDDGSCNMAGDWSWLFVDCQTNSSWNGSTVGTLLTFNSNGTGNDPWQDFTWSIYETTLSMMILSWNSTIDTFQFNFSNGLISGSHNWGNGYIGCYYLKPAIYGCADTTANNYNAAANTYDTTLCLYNGCTDPAACNYDASVSGDDGSCLFGSFGCTSIASPNYDQAATCDDGSCLVIGDFYQGGIIFHLYGNGGGLIAAPSDHSSKEEWGCYGTIINGADGVTIGTGAQNTIDIINAGCSPYLTGNSIAANICANLTLGGYSDWFLPSIYELQEMNLNSNIINATASAIGGTNLKSEYYWSSTEFNNNKAVALIFGSSSIWNDPKNLSYNVRPIRAFGNTCSATGCTDSSAFNYDASALCDDGSCTPFIYGCTDPLYTEYDPFANTDDGSCTTSSVNGCTDVTAPNYDPLANTDDGSCIGIGSTYQGGIIFYILQSGDIGYVAGQVNGLIAAPADQGFVFWGCRGYKMYSNSNAIGTGYQNTIDIEAGCTESETAADICANLTLGGYSDWFLPSIEEVRKMYQNIGQGSSLGNVGGFAASFYWSSSESIYGNEGKWYGRDLYFYTGNSQQSDKDHSGSVRAVRAF